MVDAVVFLPPESEVVARTYAYVTVDVFTTVTFEGNPLAVVTDARGLDTETMQRIAREFNLSETTFILPPDDPKHSARVRIFTPFSELPFAGHPTLGSTFVVRGSSPATEFVLEENVGLVPVRVETGADGTVQFWLTTPAITFGDNVDSNAVASALGLKAEDIHPALKPEIAQAGAPFLFVALKSRVAVDRIELLDYRALRGAAPDAPAGVFVFAQLTPDAVYSRLFAPEQGIAEDPATGSAMGPLVALMIRHGLLPREDGLRVVSEQGTKMGRRSLLHALVHITGNADPVIEVGGSVVAVSRGELTLP